jgi:hypothetical protein
VLFVGIGCEVCSLGLNILRQATVGSLYCCWSGELDRTPIRTLCELEYTTKCGWLGAIELSPLLGSSVWVDTQAVVSFYFEFLKP